MKFTTTSALLALGLAGNAAANNPHPHPHPHPFSFPACKTTSTVVVTSTSTAVVTVTSTVAAGGYSGNGGFPGKSGPGSGPSVSAVAGSGSGSGSGSSVSAGSGSGASPVWGGHSIPIGPGSVISTIGTTGTNSYSLSTTTIGSTTSHPAPTYATGTNVTSAFPTPTGGACNSPTNRQSWCGGLDINTDYTFTWPDTKKTVKYDFTIFNTTCNFDGSGLRECLAISATGNIADATVPGPLIEANWGDTIQVTLTNQMSDNGTAIHWHGIRQLGTNPQDGVPGVTECALAPGQSRTYTFQATQYGSSWYHSHYLTQYGDGIRGPIIIHGPATSNYDVDMGTVMVDDL